MTCPRCGGPIFADNGTGEGVCFNCGARLYDGYTPARPPMPEERAQAESDLLPYGEQVRILRERRKQAGPSYYRGGKKIQV